MRRRTAMAVAVFVGCIGAAISEGSSAQTDAEAYIKQSEALWAAASGKQDTATVERILADDFLGVDTQGNFFRKADELEGVSKNDGGYVSGESGEQGRYAWTDTWIRRNGRRQVVASEDVKVSEDTK